MAMGKWKTRKLVKGLRASRTFSEKSRQYRAYPPEDGRKGGRPEDNGYRRGGSK